MRRAGIGLLSGDDYLDRDERARRSRRKREQLIDVGLTPDWFTRLRGLLCLPPGMRVAIVGGGFAGLAAGWYLNACGVRTTVYEARSQVGGRVETDRNFITGKVVEAGAELIGENHPLWFELASRFGLNLVPLTTDEAYEARGLTARMIFGGHVLTTAEKTALAADLLRHWRTIGSEAMLIDEREPWRGLVARAFDAISVEARLNRLLPQTTSNTRRWFEFTLPNDNCAPLADQGYLGLLAAISAARMPPVSGPQDLVGMLGYWESTETHRCDGGNDRLATAIVRLLPDVRVNAVVDHIDIRRGLFFTTARVQAQERRPDGTTQTTVEDFDFVVLAVPPTVWRGIVIHPSFFHSLFRIQDGPAIKYLSRYSTKFWEDPTVMLAPSTKSDALGSVWEGTDNQAASGDVDLSVYAGGPFVLPQTRYPGELAALYPTGTSTGDRFVPWPTTPFIMTGYGIPAPMQVTRIGPRQIRPHADRLYFAGEQTHMGFFGYMEGALQSGARAARSIVVRSLFPCFPAPFPFPFPLPVPLPLRVAP